MNTRRTFMKWVGSLFAVPLVLNKLSEAAPEDDEFWAVLTGKKTFPETVYLGTDHRYRGEYSWVEMEETPEGSFIIKPGGRFGVAGDIDAAHEIGGSNANLHLDNKIVRLFKAVGKHWFNL